jgi:hypothetical protein
MGRGQEGKVPAYMEWPVLRRMLWDRLKDDEREDGDLVATGAELLAVLSWADNFDREAQPRRDEEQKTYDIIKRGAELIEPGDGECVFTIRVGGERSHLNTQANGIDPQTAIGLAMAALKAEAMDAENCPYHAKGLPC